MDNRFNKSLFLIIASLSSLLLPSNAVPLSRIFSSNSIPLSPASAPTESQSTTFTRSFTTISSSLESKPTINMLGLLNVAAKAAKQISPEIREFCTGTENPALCAETVSKLNGAFDPVKALVAEIDATLQEAKNVAAIIARSLSDPKTAKNALDALGICKSQYDNMLDAIKEAVTLVEQQNTVDAYYKFSAVISYKSACEDAFTESPGVDMPFVKDSIALHELGGNCLAIMDGIVNHHKFL